MRKFLVLVISLFIITLKSTSVPAYPHPISVIQPDGTILTIRLHGDENKSIRTTIDGIVIKKNVNGFYTYAQRNNKNQIVSGEKIARNPDKRDLSEQNYLKKSIKIDDIKQYITNRPLKVKSSVTKAENSNGFPTTGTPRSLVILVNFKDKSFVTPNSEVAFNNLLNQENYSENGGTGSAKDYFKAASYGQFSPQFDIVGPYTLANNLAYYGANNTDGEDVKPTQMIVDACKAADNAGLDFKIYDADNDGYVDNVFVYYAGYNEAEGGHEDTVWPHRWAIQPGNGYTGTEASRTFDGKKVFDYACTSELKGSSGSKMCGIGTFTHEFGHVIGLPDYYHTAEDKSTLDDWSIMDAGAYLNDGRTPPTYSAYDRFYLGWLTPTEINSPSNLSLYPISQSSVPNQNTNKQAYILSATTHNLNGSNPTPKEFFIMEYRRKTGWDTYLPSEGLLFWHIDYNQTAWDENTPNNYSNSSQTQSSHMRVYLQPLSGSTTTPGTAFTSGSFNPKTWSGSTINREITEITKKNDSISFKLMGGAPDTPPDDRPKITIAVVKDSLSFPTIKPKSVSTKYIKINSTELTGNLVLNLSGTNANVFSVSLASLPFESTNSKEGVTIGVSFSPKNVGNFYSVLTISGGGLLTPKVINLTGIAAE
ncbi:hypothetical protein MASR2M117_18690 [Paludibacter sp.]